MVCFRLCTTTQLCCHRVLRVVFILARWNDNHQESRKLLGKLHLSFTTFKTFLQSLRWRKNHEWHYLKLQAQLNDPSLRVDLYSTPLVLLIFVISETRKTAVVGVVIAKWNIALGIWCCYVELLINPFSWMYIVWTQNVSN